MIWIIQNLKSKNVFLKLSIINRKERINNKTKRDLIIIPMNMQD